MPSGLDKQANHNVIRHLNSPIVTKKRSRITINDVSYWDFTSNDYLGLATHPELLKQAPSFFTLGFGSTGSRLLSGDAIPFHDLEKKMALFYKKEAALVFNSGYQANCGILPALTTDQDLIISDKLCHASIIDGIQLSSAKHLRFKHNDLNHLRTLLTTHRHRYKRCILVTETLFSMDGDSPNFDTLSELKKNFDCLLYVDSAHSFGVTGPNGEGLEPSHLSHIDLLITTFGKALGSFGACVACSESLKQQLINTSRSFIFSTAIPFPVLFWNSAALDVMQTMKKERDTLETQSRWFRNEIQSIGYTTPSTSHIIPIMVGSEKRSEKMALQLQQLGFWIKPIRYPTVARHQARLRLSLTTNITHDSLKKVLDALTTLRTVD